MPESSQAPVFGPYNTLMCRPGKIASFTLNESISQRGLVVVFDFYPYPAPFGSIFQSIFAIRNAETNFVSIACYYNRDVGNLNIKIIDADGSYNIFNSTIYNSIPILSGK